MKLSCRVAEDLLPLYHDEVCSAESRALVEEHLAECEACRELLRKMDDEVKVNQKKDDMKPLAGIRSEWLRIRKKSLIRGVLITAAAVLFLWGALFALTEWMIIPYTASDMEISEVCMLPEGTVAFHLQAEDPWRIRYFGPDVDYENGVAYLIPRRSVLSVYPFMSAFVPTEGFVGLGDRYYYVSFSPFTREQSMDPAYEEEIRAFHEARPEYAWADFMFGTEVTKVCVGTKKDHVVLWEKGKELPAASEETVERYRSGNR